MSVELLLNLDDHSKRRLQKQIVDQIALAIVNGNIALCNLLSFLSPMYISTYHLLDNKSQQI